MSKKKTSKQVPNKESKASVMVHNKPEVPKDAERRSDIPKVDKVEKPKASKLANISLRGGIRGIRNWLINRMYPDERLLVNMELRNGDHSSFIIRTKAASFAYKGGEYVLDNELKYYHLDASMYALDYHQDFALPIKRIIPMNDINKAVSLSGLSKIEYSTNPSVLSKFVTSKISEGIMKGQMIDEYLKQQKLLIIITMVTVIIHFLLFVFKTGMLKSVRIPGLG